MTTPSDERCGRCGAAFSSGYPTPDPSVPFGETGLRLHLGCAQRPAARLMAAVLARIESEGTWEWQRAGPVVTYRLVWQGGSIDGARSRAEVAISTRREGAA